MRRPPHTGRQSSQPVGYSMNHLAIRASAGTGKTYELANRFIAALLETGDPATILATTFTRKAAGEILGRIIRKLADATTDTPAALRLGSEVRHAVPDRAPNWGALLAVCCRSLHHLNVSTIDSLFVRLLSGFMLEAGLASVPALTDARSPDAERLRASALSQVLAHLPHPEALRILDDLNGGKSKRSVVPRLEQTILGLYEVARSAPHEAWGRFRVPDPPEADALGAAIGTIEAVAARESRPALSKGLLASVEYAASARWADVLTKGASSKVGPSTNAPHAMPDGERFTYSRCPIPVEALAPLRTLCDAASHHLALAVRARSNAMRDLVTGYSDAYDRLARGADMLLFSDLPRTIADAVRKGGPDDLTYRLGLSIRHVLLDEFQDTSPAQWHVLKEAIVGDPQAGAAGSRSNVAPASRRHSATVFCVGDTKQAIYGWRGGCAGIFDRLEAELPGIMWEHRERSYRSSQVILDTVNRVFGGLAQIGDLDPYQAATSRWAAEYHLHVAAHNLPGYAVLMEPCDDDGPEAESDSADAEDLDASDTVSLDRASAYIAWATALIRDTP
ncbi:MAG: hypothetical protein FJX72_10505, partial [Armatimonadetes bacterium]|nr:hypothetical protein [Armatimonadota bacterium]